ncbi:MAG: hypothetical protein LIO90_04560 [Bacteroidales bacterium]|nr:hypothetical protein [Bacteroidales bacterium]
MPRLLHILLLTLVLVATSCSAQGAAPQVINDALPPDSTAYHLAMKMKPQGAALALSQWMLEAPVSKASYGRSVAQRLKRIYTPQETTQFSAAIDSIYNASEPRQQARLLVMSAPPAVVGNALKTDSASRALAPLIEQLYSSLPDSLAAFREAAPVGCVSK